MAEGNEGLAARLGPAEEVVATPLNVINPSIDSSVLGSKMPGDKVSKGSRSVSFDASRVASLKELIDLLNINIVATGRLAIDRAPSIVSLREVRLDLPRRVEKLDPVVFFHLDPNGVWCLLELRLKFDRTPFHDYNSWLIRLKKLIQSLISEFYCYYTIPASETYHGHSVMCVTDIGFDESINSRDNDTLRSVLYRVQDKLKDKRTDTRYRKIPIVSVPCLRPLIADIQSWVCEVDSDLVSWMKLFVERKMLVRNFMCDMKQGRTDIQWVRAAHPRKLPELLSLLPHLNSILIAYGGAFSIPIVDLCDFNATVMSNDVGLRGTVADPITPVISLEMNEGNLSDVRKIITSWLFPSQVMLEIQFDYQEESVAMQFFGVLCAKMLLSISPTCRNITLRNAKDLDMIIARYLERQGIPIEDPVTLSIPAGMAGGFTNIVNAMKALSTTDDGGGWVNDGSVSRWNIDGVPLYDGLSTLPCYGGAVDRIPFDERKTTTPTSYVPPIFRKVEKALFALESGRISHRKEVSVMKVLVTELKRNYICSLSNLNEHIRRAGETGFRLKDDLLRIMEGTLESYTCEDFSRESPILCNIDLRSCILLFRQMPRSFKVSDLIPRQPAIESAISSGLQRLFACYSMFSSRSKRDGENLRKGEIWDLVLRDADENISECSRAIVRMSICDNVSSFDPATIVGKFQYDDYMAHFFFDASNVITLNSELFGMTQNVVERLSFAPSVSQSEFEERRDAGILLTNSLPDDQKVKVRQMRKDQLFYLLRNKELLMSQRSSDGLVSLPIWHEFSNSLEYSWPSEELPYVVSLPSGGNVISDEDIRWGSFKRVYLLADRVDSFYPDKLIQKSPVRRFWYSGFDASVQPVSDLSVGSLLDLTVRSYNNPIHFDCILEVLDRTSSGSITLEP